MNQQSKMIITRVEKEQIMDDGSLKRFVRARVENNPVDIGSLKVPKNKDIVKIEWQVPKKQQQSRNLFDNFFG